MSDTLHLPTVTIGPKSRRIGREYGLRSSLPGLDMNAREVIQGFAEALSSWSQSAEAERRPEFALLLHLGGDNGHLLLRCAYLGLGKRGTVAVAQGLYLSPQAMERLDQNRAHVLLGLIDLPTHEEWGAEAVDVPPPFPDRTLPFSNITSALRKISGVCEVAVKDGELNTNMIIWALESLKRYNRRVIPWTTYSDLLPSRGFDPAQFQICIEPFASSPPDSAQIVIEDNAARYAGPRDALDVLFVPTEAEERSAAQWRSEATLSFASLPSELRQPDWGAEDELKSREQVFKDAFNWNILNKLDPEDTSQVLPRSFEEQMATYEVFATRIRVATNLEDKADADAASVGLENLFSDTASQLDQTAKSLGDPEQERAYRDALNRFVETWTLQVAPHISAHAQRPIDYALALDTVGDASDGVLNSFFEPAQETYTFAKLTQWLSYSANKAAAVSASLFPKLIAQLGAKRADHAIVVDQLLDELERVAIDYAFDRNQDEKSAALVLDIAETRRDWADQERELSRLFDAQYKLTEAFLLYRKWPAIEKRLSAHMDRLFALIPDGSLSDMFDASRSYENALAGGLFPLLNREMEPDLG